MNWKQLYSRSTPDDRFEAVILMLRTIETRREVVVVYIDLRRILLRAMFIGILGMLTFTTTIITAKAEPILAAPIITLYLATIFSLLLLKSQKQTAHYLNTAR